MRLHSTPESAERGEVTVLAIVETLVAMGASLLLAVYLASVRHIAIGGVAVLFMLFRTERSVQLGLATIGGRSPIIYRMLSPIGRTCFAITETCRLPPRAGHYLTHTISGMLLLPLLLVIRISATIIGAIAHPIAALSSVPNNWKRIVLCIDVRHPPEPLPGIETSPSLRELSWTGTVSSAVGEIRKHATDNRAEAILTVFTYAVLSVALYLPALLFRFVLKSTSLVHLPFLWIIRSHFGEPLSAEETLADIRVGASERLQRWYGCVVLFVTAAALASTVAAAEYPDVLERLPQNVVEPLREAFVPVEGREITFEAWHIARMLSVGIAFWLYLYADKASRRLQSGRWSEQQILSRVSAFRAILTILSAYTIYCSLAIFLYHGLDFQLPPMGLRFFPEWN